MCYTRMRALTGGAVQGGRAAGSDVDASAACAQSGEGAKQRAGSGEVLRVSAAGEWTDAAV